MGTSRAVGDAANEGALVELDEEIPAEITGSLDYRFSKIGEAIHVMSDNAYEVNTEWHPLQPLAVSERFRLLFVAHPQGFCVARTKDVMASAEDEQTRVSVRELSLVDVPMERVLMLSLSSDDSLLAACVAKHIHFFAVSALLHKEQKPSFSVSLDDSTCIKDMRWSRNGVKVYVILSSDGKLYHGSCQGPLNLVMEGVDCVDWSMGENFAVVAKKNVISIISPEFMEIQQFLLPCRSIIGDSDVNQVIKVDSVRWIRPDCIAVGCFHLNDDGVEENYVVQLITSRGGSIIKNSVSSKPFVLSFDCIFTDLSADAVPTRNGSHLLLSYIDPYGVAFVATRGFSSQVGLFSWLLGTDKNETAMVDILNDAWTLSIDLQDNDEQNVILGLSVDKASQNENERLILGDREAETSPCCVIACLTIDGKISLFHFASTAGVLPSPDGCAEKENDTSRVSVESELSQISSAVDLESSDPTFLTSKRRGHSNNEVEIGSKALISNNLFPSQIDVRSRAPVLTENSVEKPLADAQIVKLDNPGKSVSVMRNKDVIAENQSEVVHRTGFLSGKVVGDNSHPSTVIYPLLSDHVEPLGKAPTSSLKPFSLTTSNARLGDPRTSGEWVSSPLSDETINSNKHLMQPARSLQLPEDKGERTNSSLTSTSFGLNSMTSQGTRTPSLAFYGSQAPLGKVATSRKPFQYEFKNELATASSPSGRPHSSLQASKHPGNVEEITQMMDNLLEGIEKKGGFIDASITSQTNSVVELEDGLQALSRRCRMWQGLMDEKQRELILLLDKTVQVMARKVNVEGIFKQAMDSRYWELWNRQKLSCEMELKLKNILQTNQELTNRLIELERHFNSLEFSKFGEIGGTQRQQRVVPDKHRHSRQVKSLHSLHNTMHAQLAAAEHLSGCLSKQMASLSIDPPEKHGMKKQLFESIGLSCAVTTDISPPTNRTSGAPVRDPTLFSVATREEGRRNAATFAGNSEPETARRRRYSLDHSLASFEPTKTTVKRTKEEFAKASSSQLSFDIDKQFPSPDKQKLDIPHLTLKDIGASSNQSTTEIPGRKITKSQSTLSYQRTADPGDLGTKVSSTRSILVPPPPSVLETGVTKSSGHSLHLMNELSKSTAGSSGKSRSSAISEFKLGKKSDKITYSVPGSSFVTSGPSINATDKQEASSPQQTSPSTLELSPGFSSAINRKNLSPESSFSSAINAWSLASSSQPSSAILCSKTEDVSQVQNPVAVVPSETVKFFVREDPAPQSVPQVSTFNVKFGPPASMAPTPLSINSGPNSQLDLSDSLKSSSIVSLSVNSDPPSIPVAPPVELSSQPILGSPKNISSDQMEEMEEEASETSKTTDISLGTFDGFGIGSKPNLTTPKGNPFGTAMVNGSPSFGTSPFMTPSSSGELFRPASFSFPSPSPPQPVQPSGFSPGISGQASGTVGFGQPAHLGAGQQALGSVLGSFGQSRQLGAGVPGSNFASASSFGSGLTGTSGLGFGAPVTPSGGGFSGLAAGSGGFSGLAAGGGGFAAAATAGGGGFAAAATAGGGFAAAATAGGGFAAAAANAGGGFASSATASQVPGGGFGGFVGQGGGGFSAFGGGSGTGIPPSQLFTQMRK